jgi:hypothetical protein
MRVNEIVLLNQAVEDLKDGEIFYNNTELGIGTYFWDSLISDIESLIIFAGIHPKKYGLFQMLSKRFPYSIYYEIVDSVAYVIAILPMRRNPSWISEELKNRH